jgi:hypothetical protein
LEVDIVFKEDINIIFPFIKDYLKGAADYTHGRYTVEDIHNDITSGNKQLWVTYEGSKIYGAVVTEILNYPQKKVLVLHFTGGIEFDKWHKAILESLKLFAKQQQCDAIEFCGRNGWTKLFKQDGYKPIFTFYELTLEN